MAARKCGLNLAMKHWSDTKKCALSTLSPLVNIFNGMNTKSLNFNLISKNTGLFGIPLLHESEGFYLMKTTATEKSDQLVEEALNNNRSRKMVEIFDHLSDNLCQVADLAEFIRIAHPTASFSSAAEDASVSISGLVEQLNTNFKLYESLKHVVDNGDIYETDAVDNHVADLFLFDFEQSGIHLSEKKRNRVVKLNEAILQLGSVFMNNSQQVKIVPSNIIHKDIRHFFPRDGDNLIVNGLFADCYNEQAREAAYRIYLSDNMHQSKILNDLLKCRHEMAVLCGFSSYNERAVKGSLAGSPQMVNDFLHKLSSSVKNCADAEFNEMKKIKLEKGSNKPLMPWDVPYIVACTKYDRLRIESASFSPYFSVGACMEGLSNLFQCLYGITLEPEIPKHGEVWYTDVQKLAVTHETEGTLGHIYCDFFERPGKPSHDCHFTIRGGKQLENGSYQTPIVVLMLNFPSPSLIRPSLLTPSMVENLFHEIGHAMHSMLARTKYQHVTGTRCSTDFAEVPSVLMEYFATDPRVLSSFAKHYKTGEAMPEEMLRRLCASKRLFIATDVQLQLFYSMLDQRLHNPNSSEITSQKILENTQNQYYGLNYISDTHWHLTFGHLVGYGAKYYSYLMSRAVASWIWHANFQNDPFSRDSGEKYRHEVLSHGGGKPPKALVQDYLGKSVTPSSLASSLLTDIEKNKFTFR